MEKLISFQEAAELTISMSVLFLYLKSTKARKLFDNTNCKYLGKLKSCFWNLGYDKSRINRRITFLDGYLSLQIFNNNNFVVLRIFIGKMNNKHTTNNFLITQMLKT